MATWPDDSPSWPAGIATAEGGGGGGGGNPDLVSGGAPTNGGQALASGTTSSSAITFNAPTGGSGASTPSAAVAHINGSGATLSGSGLGPYTVNNLEDGDLVTVTCTHTDDGDGQVVEDVAVVGVGTAAGGGASWADVWEADLTSDMTTLALTLGGGEETIYEADGTTPKIKATYFNRAGAPTSTATADTASGGLVLDLTSGSSNNAAAVAINLSETETGAVWDDSHLYAIDVLLTGCAMTAGSNGFILCGPGTKAAGINSGFSMTHRHRRASGSSFTQSGRRYEGGSANVGADQVDNSSIAADIALRFVVTTGGHTVTLYWAEQTTYLSSATLVPVTGASLWRSFSGSNAFSIEAAAEFRFNSSQPYLHLDLQYSGSGTASATVGKIRIQRWE